MGMDYKKAGVDIDTADASKREMKNLLTSENSRVLNSVGAFASLIDIQFNDIERPVLVMKMEEPGSKQLLAAQHGQLASVGIDLVNHLINDTIMMGCRPLAIQDTIICGHLEQSTVVALVKSMADACRAQDCDLVGGETSEQPRVIPEGSYILSAACVGIVDRSKIVDGTQIRPGDSVLAIESNGVHTNGYTLIRSLLEKDPQLAEKLVDGERFIDIVLRPHLCYNRPVQASLQTLTVHGLAHVTGGGIVDNLQRILPDGCGAEIDLELVRVPPIFSAIQRAGEVPADDMLRTFNCGVGMMVVVPDSHKKDLVDLFRAHEVLAYPIGTVVSGPSEVRCHKSLAFHAV